MSTSPTAPEQPRAPGRASGATAPLSLRILLAVAFGTLAGALTIALSLIIGHYASDAARIEISRDLTRLAIEYRDKLDTSLAERMDDISALAILDTATADAAAPERRRARIDQLIRNKDFAWIGYAGAAGRVEVASGRLLEGSDVSSRRWFSAARERTALLDAHEEVLLSKLLPPGAGTRRFVDLAVPLGAGRGAVGAHVDFAWAARLRADIESYSDPRTPFELLLVQGDGTVLIGPAALIGQKVPLPLGARVNAPAVIERWPDGEEYLAGGSPSRGIGEGLNLGWVSIAREHATAAFAPVAELQRAILWAGLALALAGIAAGWLLATRLARPLESLASAALAIAAGEHRTSLPLLRNNLEVARLSAALRGMLSHLREQAESLRDAQDRLEQRVRERTAELVELQAQLELEIADTMIARDDLAKAREQLELALTASNQVLWDFDIESDRVYLGPTWSQMLGGPAIETRTSSRELYALVPEPERSRVLEAVQQAIAGKSNEYRIEHPVSRKDGGTLWIASVGRVIEREADGRARRIVGTNRDISERVEAQRNVEALALHDALTGLPNKRLLEDRLTVALAAARREKRPLGLLFIDLDAGAQSGDARAGKPGNAVLVELALRARAALRETDTFAHMGGHEFVAVLPGAGAEVLSLPASRLLKLLSQPVTIEGRTTTANASIGAAQSVAGAEDPDTLLKRADELMTEARSAGRNTIRYHKEK